MFSIRDFFSDEPGFTFSAFLIHLLAGILTGGIYWLYWGWVHVKVRTEFLREIVNAGYLVEQEIPNIKRKLDFLAPPASKKSNKERMGMSPETWRILLIERITQPNSYPPGSPEDLREHRIKEVYKAELNRHEGMAQVERRIRMFEVPLEDHQNSGTAES